MLPALCALAFLQTTPFDFLGFGPYDRSVPTPTQVLGYGPGERHTPFHDQERVLAAYEKSNSARLKVFEYGKSTEGRRLRLAVIGSTKNLARLDQIRANTSALATADPTKNLEDVIKETPVIVWINETIHGDESASFESGMWLIYNLIASENPAVVKALDDALVIVNPCYNPDGHERFVVWYNSVAIGSPNPNAFEQRQPDVMGGRTNHYRFDMNRDRVAFSQLESRQEAAALLQWHPQVYADQHGEVSGYFFPPCPMSININAGRDRYNKWTTVFGKANGEVFDRYGWLYFVRKEFDFYYPGYLDTFSTLSGAIGMTHETNGGSRLALANDAGGTVTLRDGMMKHFTTALTLIQSSASHREELLREFSQFKKDGWSGKSLGDFRRVILTGDPRALQRLATQLSFGGAKSAFATKPFQQRATDYWTAKSGNVDFPAGSLVIDVAQEQAAFAKIMLEPGSEFEPEFIKRQMEIQKNLLNPERYPRRDQPEFYDITGWSQIFGHELRGWWSADTPSVSTASAATLMRPAAAYGKIGAVLRYTDRQDILAVFDLLAADVHVAITGEEMKLGGETIAKSSFLILREHNPNTDVAAALQKVSEKRGVVFRALDTAFPDVGGSGPLDSSPLKKPDIAVVFGSGGDTTDFGGIWYAMEQLYKLPFTPVSSDVLSSPGTQTCIVCPPGTYGQPSDALKSWVRSGGCLVLLGSPEFALGEKSFASFEMKRGARLPGALFKASLNPRSPFVAGYDASQPIMAPVSGGSFPKIKAEGGAVVSFDADPKAKKLLSGWEWEDTEGALAGTVWMHDIPYGGGHVILFAEDPTDRALWPGLDRLLLNSMLLGPG